MSSKFSKRLVIFIIIFTSLFFISAVVYQYMYHDSYDPALIGGFVGFYSAEAGVLGWIKIKKVKLDKACEKAIDTAIDIVKEVPIKNSEGANG